MTANNLTNSKKNKKQLAFKTVVAILTFSVMFYAGFAAFRYFHFTIIQTYLRDGIQLSLSSPQMELALAGITGLLASVLIGRRRSKRIESRPPKMTPMVVSNSQPSHPLMVTPRPARDSNFVIRRTRKPGRISRNRMGERLPPSNVVQPGLEES